MINFARSESVQICWNYDNFFATMLMTSGNVVKMNHQAIKKFFLGLVLFLITGCACFASDYKYKVLDPRYNSSIEDYTYDEETSRLIEKTEAQKKSPFRKKMLIVLLGVVPLLFLVRTVRVLKKVDDDATVENFSFVREFFAVDKIKGFNKTVLNTTSYIKDSLCVVKPVSKVNAEKFTETIEKIKQRQDESLAQKMSGDNRALPKLKNTASAKTLTPAKIQPQKPFRLTKEQLQAQASKNAKSQKPLVKDVKAYEKGMDSYVQATMQKMKNPILITTSKLASNKGFCIVEFNKEFSLIGYIGEDIYILDKFKKLPSAEIRTRLSERINNKDRYIVRLGNYKSLVEVSNRGMKMLMEL